MCVAGGLGKFRIPGGGVLKKHCPNFIWIKILRGIMSIFTGEI